MQIAQCHYNYSDMKIHSIVERKWRLLWVFCKGFSLWLWYHTSNKHPPWVSVSYTNIWNMYLDVVSLNSNYLSAIYLSIKTIYIFYSSETPEGEKWFHTKTLNSLAHPHLSCIKVPLAALVTSYPLHPSPPPLRSTPTTLHPSPPPQQSTPPPTSQYITCQSHVLCIFKGYMYTVSCLLHRINVGSVTCGLLRLPCPIYEHIYGYGRKRQNPLSPTNEWEKFKSLK